jgi:hypothetical protein
MRLILLPSVLCPILPYFYTLSHERHDFRKKKKKVIEHKVVFDFLYIFYEIFLTLRRSKRVIIINEHRFACKVPVISVKF